MADKYEPERVEAGGPLPQRTSPVKELEQQAHRALLGAIYFDDQDGDQ
ncbi:hypothetical protein [Promicromonospora sp. NPDC050880]